MEERKQIHLLGVSFRNAPLAVREALAFDRCVTVALLRKAREKLPAVEALVLSTCNRTEIYLAAPLGTEPVDSWLNLLCNFRHTAPTLREDCHRYQLQGSATIRHLMQVATGLDSAILGDAQILGQVKKALALAGQSGTLGSFLHQITGQSIRAGKRARSETSIGCGAASVGSALAGMLARRAGCHKLRPKPGILIIGAGEIARNIGRHLVKRQIGEITIINRTARKAGVLAEDCGARTTAWETLEKTIQNSDVVISAVASSQPVLKLDMLNRLVKGRDSKPLLLVDAGVPRNIETGGPWETWNIDAIRECQTEVLQSRRAAIPQVERIIAEELKKWEKWTAARPMEKLLKEVFQNAAKISKQSARELAAAANQNSSEAQGILHRSLCNLLHEHARSLRKNLFMPFNNRQMSANRTGEFIQPMNYGQQRGNN